MISWKRDCQNVSKPDQLKLGPNAPTLLNKLVKNKIDQKQKKIAVQLASHSYKVRYLNKGCLLVKYNYKKTMKGCDLKKNNACLP